MQQDEQDPRADGPRPYEVLWTPGPEAPAEAVAAPETTVPPVARPRAVAAEPARRGGHGWGTTLLVAALAAGLTMALGLPLTHDEVRAEEPPELAKLRADLATAARELELAHRVASEADLRAAESERMRLADASAVGESTEKLREQLSAAHSEQESLAAELAAARVRVEELAAHPPALAAESTDEQRATRVFEAGLTAVTEARLADAREACVSLERLGLGGAVDLARVVEVGEALGRFEASCATGPVVPGELRAALNCLESARGAQTTLVAARIAWLAPSEVATRVCEALSAALAALAARADAAKAKLKELDDAQWATLVNQWKAVQSTDALEHAARFGCGHLAEVAPKLVPELRMALFRFRRLDLAQLRDLKGLSEWAERARLGSVTLSPRERADLELLAFGQRWFDDQPGNELPPDWATIEFDAPAGEHGDWRRELQLLWSLSQPESGFPVRDNGLRIYRLVDAQGRVEWWRELAISARDGVWRVQRDRIAADGEQLLASDTLRIERRGGEFVLADTGETLLDLRALGATTRVAVFSSQLDASLPDVLGVDAAALGEFRGRQPVCVIHALAGTRRWFEPRWGLVREEVTTTRGLVVRDLVFAR